LEKKRLFFFSSSRHHVAAPSQRPVYARDTIAAIATPPGQGGVAIIRLSGPEAEHIAQSLVLLKHQSFPLRSHHLYLGEIVEPRSGQRLDQGLFTIMRAPHSYTGEHVAELHCHGGGFLARRILAVVLQQGARLAEPGEFTKRAFLNGKLDLAQAEAVLNLIEAKSEQGAHLAWEQLSGQLSEAVNYLRQRLVHTVAYIEAFLDFPEEDIPIRSQSEIEQEVAALIEDIASLAATFQQGRVYRDGTRTAIVGKPNVGKSSLLNLLLGTERAIVTNVPGTTRDILEETVIVGGIPLVLWDMAGLRQTNNEVERIGVARAQAGVKEAELVLAVFDGTRPLDEEDTMVLATLSGKKVVPIVNKVDCPSVLNEAALAAQFPEHSLVKLSSKTGAGRNDLDRRIQETVFATETSHDHTPHRVIVNARHRDALLKSEQCLKNTLSGLRFSLPLDLVAVDLHAALDHIGEITGHVTSEDILDQVFREFCIGK
jgi:tRNA modification GTPase